MKPLFLLIFLSLYLSLTSSSPTPSTSNNPSTTCPMDLGYVLTIPWPSTDCRDFHSSTPQLSNNSTQCCQTLLSLYGIALAQHLKTTSLFQLPNLPISISCLSDFQSKLNSLSLPSDLTSLCFDPLQFVISPNTCASIQSTKDWVSKLGPSTPLDPACQPDLTILPDCNACVDAGFQVQAELITIDGNKSHSINCLYFTILYAAGIVNEFGPESTSSITCILNLPLDSHLGSSSKRHLALILGLTGAGVFILVICCLLVLYFFWDRKWRKQKVSSDLGEEELGIRPRMRPNTDSIWFKFSELEKATESFSPKNFIGRGSFGTVFKGTLADGSLVAVKQLLESDFQGNDEFYTEVKIVSNLKHRNLVLLRGCCVPNEDETDGDGRDSQRYLVYDYMPNGNLDDHLFGNRKQPLSWQERKSIIMDIANGIAYLHYGVKPAIYHRDIKGTNILLDTDMKARLADFGLAKQGREGQSHVTASRVAGTHGYLAPEYALYGQLSERSDVYSFGVVVLEVMCGRKALDDGFVLTDWAWLLAKSGTIEEALDASLLRDGDSENGNIIGIMERFLLVGIMCAHAMVVMRPSILDAIKMLEGDIEVSAVPDRPTTSGH